MTRKRNQEIEKIITLNFDFIYFTSNNEYILSCFEFFFYQFNYV